MRNRLASFGIAASLTFGVMMAQVEPVLSFEVASIRPNPDRAVVIDGRRVQGARIGLTNIPPRPNLSGIRGNRYAPQPIATVTTLMMDAYKAAAYQVSGGPKWASFDGDAFEINAKAPGEATPTSDQVRRMLQTLLAERFKLKFHLEKRPLPVYRLMIAPSGLKIKEVSVESDGKQPANSTDLRMVAMLISNFLDLPLIDGTGLGLAKVYEFKWDQSELLPELSLGKPAPSIFGAVQDQLGLKLERANEPMDVLVIDSVERPSEN